LASPTKPDASYEENVKRIERFHIADEKPQVVRTTLALQSGAEEDGRRKSWTSAGSNSRKEEHIAKTMARRDRVIRGLCGDDVRQLGFFTQMAIEFWALEKAEDDVNELEEKRKIVEEIMPLLKAKLRKSTAELSVVEKEKENLRTKLKGLEDDNRLLEDDRKRTQVEIQVMHRNVDVALKSAAAIVKAADETKAAVDESKEKVTNLTEELEQRSLDVAVLNAELTDSQAKIVCQIQIIKEQMDLCEKEINEKKDLESRLRSLEANHQELQSTCHVWAQQASAMTNRYENTKEELDLAVAQSKSVRERVEDLESCAAERARLQQANAKSRWLPYVRPGLDAKISAVSDFAGFFLMAAAENLDSLNLLMETVPEEKTHIQALLRLLSEKELDIARMSDVLKHFARIIGNRG
jgi:septation ring formation regulator EzrA